MSSIIKIKEALLGDASSLAILFDQYRVFYGKEPDVNTAFNFLTERIRNKESVIYIANVDAEVVGFVQLYPIFSSTQMRRLWLLNDLFVLEKHRGKGISILLIDAAKKLALETNAAGLLLETAIDNRVANSLYRSTGFELDINHNYYVWNNLNS